MAEPLDPCLHTNIPFAGFYIRSCPKMAYKGEYKPSELLDVHENVWKPFAVVQEEGPSARRFGASLTTLAERTPHGSTALNTALSKDSKHDSHSESDTEEEDKKETSTSSSSSSSQDDEDEEEALFLFPTPPPAGFLHPANLSAETLASTLVLPSRGNKHTHTCPTCRAPVEAFSRIFVP